MTTVDIPVTIGQLRGSNTTASPFTQAWTVGSSVGQGTITMDNTGGLANIFGTTTAAIGATTTSNLAKITVNSNLVIANTDLTIGTVQNVGPIINGNITASTAQKLILLNNSNSSGSQFNINGSIGASGSNIAIETAHTANGGVSHNIQLSGIIGPSVTGIKHSVGSGLVIDYNLNGAADHIADTVGVSLGNGAQYTQQNSAATTATTETIKSLSLLNGANTVTLSGGINNTTAVLSIGSTGFSRADNATALIRANNLHVAATSSVAANRITIDGVNGTGLTLIGTNDAAQGLSTAGTDKQLKIVPYFLGGFGASSVGTNFLTYDTDATNYGLRTLQTNEQSLVTVGATGDNVKATAAANNITGAKTFNSLLITNAVSTAITGDGNQLNLTSGALASVQTGASGSTNISGFSGIVFGSTGANEAIITNANVTAGGVLTIGSPISTSADGGGLTKTGAGIVVLAGANTYTGRTTINHGTLQIGDGTNGSLDPASEIKTVGTTTTGSTPSIPGTLSLNLVNNGVLTNTIVNDGGIVKVTGANTNTVAGNITGVGTLGASASGGTLVLSGVNSYTGATTIGATGTLQFRALPTNITGVVSGSMSPTSNLVLTASDPAVNAAGGTLQLRSDTNTSFTPGTLTYAGRSLSGAGLPSVITIDVGSNGSGTNNTLTLTKPFTYSTNVGLDANASIVNVTASDGYKLNFTLVNGSSAHQYFNVANTAKLEVQTLDTPSTVTSSTFGFIGAGETTLNTLARSTTSRSMTILKDGAGTLNLNGSATAASATSQAGYFFTTKAGILNVNHAEALGKAALPNAYSRVLTISGGTLDASNGDITSASNPNVVIDGNFTFGGTNSLTLGTSTAGGASLGTAAGTSRTITANGVGDTAEILRLGGLANGTNASALTKTGGGKLALDGVAFHTGGTVVDNGTLYVNGGTIAGGAFNLTTTVNSQTATVANTTIANSLRVGQNLSGGNVGTGNYIIGISGTTITLAKNATATASNISTTGAGGSATGTGAVVVSGTGRLGGNGTIAPTGSNAVSFDAGTTVAPGNSIGTLTFALANTTGGVSFGNAATGEFELGAPNASINTIAANSSDVVAVTGASASDVSFNNAVVDLKNTATGDGYYKLFDTDLTSGTTWTGLTVDGNGVITGGLSVANVGTGYSATLLLGDGSTGTLNSDDIYLSVVAVPEPTSLAAIALAGAGLLRRRRRQMA